jgi:hypothetical protein
MRAMLALDLTALAAVAAAFVAVRRARALGAEVGELRERIHDMSRRLEAAEHDVSQALASADVAESVLLEKGVADEEDLEAARRRFGDDAVRYVRGRDGEIH